MQLGDCIRATEKKSLCEPWAETKSCELGDPSIPSMPIDTGKLGVYGFPSDILKRDDDGLGIGALLNSMVS